MFFIKIHMMKDVYIKHGNFASSIWCALEFQIPTAWGLCFGIGGDGRRVFFAGPWSPPYGSPSLTHFSTRTKTKNPKIQSQNTTKQKLGPFDLSERKFKPQRNFKIGWKRRKMEGVLARLTGRMTDSKEKFWNIFNYELMFISKKQMFENIFQ